MYRLRNFCLNFHEAEIPSNSSSGLLWGADDHPLVLAMAGTLLAGYGASPYAPL
jgi:hypothetical protein